MGWVVQNRDFSQFRSFAGRKGILFTVLGERTVPVASRPGQVDAHGLSESLAQCILAVAYLIQLHYVNTAELPVFRCSHIITYSGPIAKCTMEFALGRCLMIVIVPAKRGRLKVAPETKGPS